MRKKANCVRRITAVFLMICIIPGFAFAQLSPVIDAELRKLGPVVEPGCTAKLMRPLFGKNDYNTYWPVDAAMPNTKVNLYSGVTMARDVKFGPEAKDLIDIFSGSKGSASRTVLIYVPGGAGNKIEQQSVEANMFYDNIGVWATENGMVGVTMQRGGTAAGQNIALMIEWLQANIAKYKGNPNSMVIWAHSAGNQPLGQYIGRPDLYGMGVKGALFMSGNPVNFGARGGAGGGAGRGAAPAAGGPGGGAPAAAGAGGGGGRGGGGGLGGGANGVIGTSTCTNTAGAGSQAGVIRGPSSQLPEQGAGAAARRAELAGTSPWRWDGKQWVSTGTQTQPPAAAGGGGGGRGGGGGAGGGGRGGGAGAPGGAPAAADAAPAFTTQDGFRVTRTKIAIAWAELDAGAAAGMPAGAVAIHDELCKLEGPKAKDGVGHCPTMMWFKGESHMSEVFSLGSSDKTVATPVLAWIKSLD